MFECFETRGKVGLGVGGLLGPGVWRFVVETGAEKCCAMEDGVRWLRYPRVYKCIYFYAVTAGPGSLGIRV